MLQIEHPFLQVFLLKQKSIISTSESRESIREFVTKNTDTDMAMTTSDIDTHINGQCVSVSDVGSRTCFHMVVDRSTSCFHTDGHVMSTSSTSCIHVVNISYPHAHIMASVSSSVTWVDAVVVDVGLFGVSSCSPRSFDDLISWSCWKYVEKNAENAQKSKDVPHFLRCHGRFNFRSRWNALRLWRHSQKLPLNSSKQVPWVPWASPKCQCDYSNSV